MKKIIIGIVLIALITASCSEQKKTKESKESNATLKVFAVNYPLLYFAERIGGEYIELVYPIPSDEDPAYWVPNNALEEIQSADLILANGANFAKWMEKVSLPSSKIIFTSAAFREKYIKIEEGSTHSHGVDGKHVHYGYAFTTWLDFNIAIGHAETIMNALTKKRPQYKEVFASNFEDLRADLKKLDEDMSLVAKKLKGQTLFASHPVYQYLSQAYGLDIVSVHWEPGDLLTEKQWSVFKQKFDQHPSRLMLWENEPLEEVKKLLNEIGMRVIVFNPCGNHPETGDFIAIMNENINSLQNAI